MVKHIYKGICQISSYLLTYFHTTRLAFPSNIICFRHFSFKIVYIYVCMYTSKKKKCCNELYTMYKVPTNYLLEVVVAVQERQAPDERHHYELHQRPAPSNLNTVHRHYNGFQEPEPEQLKN